jgi:hypothetical protein
VNGDGKADFAINLAGTGIANLKVLDFLL